MIAINTLAFISYLESLPPKTILVLDCPECNIEFERNKNVIQSKFGSYNDQKLIYCSHACSSKALITKQKVFCLQCNYEFEKLSNQVKRSPNHFCSRSCAGTYNNTHKIKGNRRSKLENWLEQQLLIQYPDLEIHFNKKDAINSELDIYIPSLKLAFELNGIFHYEPIYGHDKLSSIQNNDNRKFQACLEQGIELVIIDTSGQKYFKEKSSQKFFEIITRIINSKLEQ